MSDSQHSKQTLPFTHDPHYSAIDENQPEGETATRPAILAQSLGHLRSLTLEGKPAVFPVATSRTPDGIHNAHSRNLRSSISNFSGPIPRASNLPPGSQPHSAQPRHPHSPDGNIAVPDPEGFLRLAAGVVKGRQGSVLSRGSLLKTDHWASGRAQTLAHHLQGAPNFRPAVCNIFGTAQPSLSGIKTVLAFLKSHPNGRGRAVWFCTREEPVVYISARPFVLRDSVRPTQTFAISERASNIEAIESRLKLDILKEANKYGGLVLVHDETVEGDILPAWITADDVKTTREVWEEVKGEGYRYHRIPISSDQAPEDSYLDHYVAILKNIPTTTSLVFNCGMGVIRTTFAMAAAIIMRRRQVIKEGGEDIFSLNDTQVPLTAGDQTRSKAIKAMRMVGEQQIRTRSLLKLMQLLQKCLPTANQHAVMQLLTTQPALLENLRKGIIGDYDIIMSLVSILDQGTTEKDLVDIVIDINLRDDILEHRIKFAITAATKDDEAADEDERKHMHLKRALAGLERYFFLIAFSGYCNEPPMTFNDTFSPWLKTRSEISNMILRLRRTARQYVFTPVHDLSSLTRGHVGTVVASTAAMKLQFADLERAGGEIVGTEWAHHIVDTRRGITLRAGLILKSDQWPTQFTRDDCQIRGAVNFRKVHGTSLFGLSQPTQEGIDRIVEKGGTFDLYQRCTLCSSVGGGGTSQHKILRRDIERPTGASRRSAQVRYVLAELRSFDGRILLHTETDDGSIIGMWESAAPSAIKTLREIMDEKSGLIRQTEKYRLDFRRQPITAEKAPDFEDIKDLIGFVSDAEANSPFIVNCQLGRGRSTLTMVCIILIQQWLAYGGARFAFAEPTVAQRRSRAQWSYQTINNLTRVMRNGRGIKAAVDAAIEKCSAVYDLIESIETCRQAAEESTDDAVRKEGKIKKGLANLRRYAFVLIFACYLNETKANTRRELEDSKSFELFWKEHQVFRTILDELNGADIQALTPLEMGSFAAHGVDWTEEEQTVVSERAGIILSAQTILKSDFFVGLQKMTLPLRIEGLPNIRQVLIRPEGDSCEPSIFGSGMPTLDGMRRGLEKMGAAGANARMVYWTSMREEPVLYVRGRPHVLRLFDQPLENVITTGVAAAAVEGMEAALKSDVLNEIREMNGRLLLHDEVEENGKFCITALWETVAETDIMTPREVFNLMKAEGFAVDYARLPVTDEQAPLPGVFSRLEQRVRNALSSGLENGQVGAHLVFNCQMGRGRTTTGMVAAMLVAGTMSGRHKAYDSRAASVMSLDVTNRTQWPTSPVPTPPGTVSGGDTWDGVEADPYLEGEYKTILQLVGVLQHGRLAKRITDKAIERKAVYDFKLRAEAAEPGSEKQRKITTAATNYLYRYGSLIAFADWLLERADMEDDEARESIPSFPKWLQDHREITHILQKRSLE
ncbi:inositol hexakisphosphate-domain-containing protein [Melampsora americana]|nr:inositol hexakisphosphate-domain-containing protein [Melampsora americana]